jgi:NAD(P)-dependent dehydrogenase (short-subunit alcohol dehydrogenase family)
MPKWLERISRRLGHLPGAAGQRIASSPPLPIAPMPAALDQQLLRHKNVLITGAGPNIGRSIALEMARQGANIFFTDIDAEQCQLLAQELKAFPVTAQGYGVDMTQPECLDRLCQDLRQAGITIDILVNNVGVQFEDIGLRHSSLTQWQTTFNTNVVGPVYLSQQITEAMIEQGIRGSVLFITSIHQFTISRWPSYSASKAALGMVIEELAVELAAHGIRVNGIAPGWVAADEQGKPQYHPHIPLDHQSIHPDYIGRAAVYLAADYFSQGTTGTVLKIDGGLSLYNSRVAQHPV